MVREGDTIGGRYRLEQQLGEGGMAAVYEAEDLMLHRKVAVKILFARDERDKSAMARAFLREARICAAVHHRHVVSITDFGTTDEEMPYMVMERLEGRSLADALYYEGTLAPEAAIELAVLVLRGLAAVHGAGIVHSDLKPENIFLVDDADGPYPKILDFGISRSIDPGSGRRSARTTSPGQLIGTPEYMSPEQARGGREIDVRTDIYSLGVILYEAMAGKTPYAAEGRGDLIIMIASGGAMPLEALGIGVPPALSEVIEKSMAVEREDRYQTARDMQQALLDAARSMEMTDVTGKFGIVRSNFPPPMSSTSPGSVRPPARTSDRPLARVVRDVPTLDEEPAVQLKRRWPLVAGAVIAGCLGGFGLIVVLRSNAATPPARPPPAAAPEPRTVEVEAQSPTVQVLLRRVPRDAVIRVDGVVSTLPIVLPRDGAVHAIEVTHPAMIPFRVMHVASVDSEYDVVVEPAPVPTSVVLADEGERDDGDHRRSRTTMMTGEMTAPAGEAMEEAAAMGEATMAGAFRELDY